jgi:hypothetical protein
VHAVIIKALDMTKSKLIFKEPPGDKARKKVKNLPLKHGVKYIKMPVFIYFT